MIFIQYSNFSFYSCKLVIIKNICVIILILLSITSKNDLINAQTVIDTIDVGNLPRGIAANPNTNLIYVTNMNNDNVSVIDGVTNEIVVNIAVGGRPLGVAVSIETNRVYVGDANGITVIDGLVNKVVATIPFESSFDDFPIPGPPPSDPIPEPPPSDPSVPGFGEVFTRADMIVVNPIDNRIYLACGCSGNVLVIDIILNEHFDSITIPNLGSGIFGLGINTLTDTIYVANVGSKVFVIKGKTSEIVDIIELPVGDFGVNEITNRIYIGRGPINSSVVVDGSSNDVIATTESTSDSGVNVVGVNVATNHIFIGNFDGSLTVIDGFTNEIITTLNGGHRPSKIAVNQKTGLVYVLTIDHNKPELEKVTIIQDKFLDTGSDLTKLRADFFVKPEPGSNKCCTGITGTPPLTAEFADLSIGDPNNWFWEFGDGATSFNQNTSHVYNEFGVFSVKLTVSNSTTSSIREKQFLVNSFPPTPTIPISGLITPINVVTPKPLSTPILTVTPIITSIPTPISTPSLTIESTPVHFPELSVSPVSAKNSLLLKDATVTVKDQNGKPLFGILVTATVFGRGTVVTPVSQTTDNDGIAKFQFRFGFITKDGEIIFNANNLNGTIMQE